MFKRLYVLGCGFVAAIGWVGAMSDVRAHNCECDNQGSPTTQEVFDKVEAQSTRDIARIEKTQAQERRSRAQAGSHGAASSPMPISSIDAAPIPGAYRVIVSIDAAASAAPKKLDQIVAAFEQKSGKQIKRRSAAWRDGGFSVCMPLAELDKAQQQAFVSELRSNLLALGQVHVDEHALCGRELRPTH